MSIFGILEYFWTFLFRFYIINHPKDLKNKGPVYRSEIMQPPVAFVFQIRLCAMSLA